MFEIFSEHVVQYGQGIASTLILALVGTIGGFLLGIFLGLGRTLKSRETDNIFVRILKKIANGICYVYIWVFRGTPMMIQGLIFYVGLEGLLGFEWVLISSHPIFSGYLICGLIVITLNTAAYIGEIIRGGIESIDKGQGEAARSLGMTYAQSMIKVVLPQAVRNSIPAIGNEFIVNIKDSSVLNVIGLAELFYVNKAIILETSKQIECYFIVALIYLTLTLFFTIVFKIIEKKMDGKKIFKFSLFKHTRAYSGEE